MVKAITAKNVGTTPRKLNWEKLVDAHKDEDGIIKPHLYALLNLEESVVEPDKIEFAIKMKAVKTMFKSLNGKLECNSAYYHIARILAKTEETLKKMGRSGKDVCKAIGLDSELIAQFYYSKDLARDVARDHYTEPKRVLEILRLKEKELLKIVNDEKYPAPIRMKALNDLAKPYEDAIKEGAKYESMNFYGNNSVDASDNKQIDADIHVDSLRGGNNQSLVDDTRKIMEGDDYEMLNMERILED